MLLLAGEVIGKYLAGLGLLVLACAQAPAAPAPAARRRWDSRLQQWALAPASQRNAADGDAMSRAPDAAQQQRMTKEDPALAPKLAALALLDQALREGRVAPTPIDRSSASSILLDGPGAPGTSCSQPLRLEAGQVLRVDATRAGAHGYWLEVRARELGLRFTDLGSAEGKRDPRLVPRLVRLCRRERPAILHTHTLPANFVGRAARVLCRLHLVPSSRAPRRKFSRISR